MNRGPWEQENGGKKGQTWSRDIRKFQSSEEGKKIDHRMEVLEFFVTEFIRMPR